MAVVSDSDSSLARGEAIFASMRRTAEEDDSDAEEATAKAVESGAVDDDRHSDDDPGLDGAPDSSPMDADSTDFDAESEAVPTPTLPSDLVDGQGSQQVEDLAADAAVRPTSAESTESEDNGEIREALARTDPTEGHAASASVSEASKRPQNPRREPETSEVPVTPPPSSPAPPKMPAEVAVEQELAAGQGLRGMRGLDFALPDAAAPSASDDATARRDAAGHGLPRILAVANQKGGVGKTTTAVNLGAALAEVGYRTLVVDLDPQGNASTGLGINIRDLHLSMYDVVIHEASIDDTIEATAMRNLFVAPASLDLAGAEIELVPAFSRELRLRHALAEVEDDYDYVLIDCPPSLGLLTINGLAAAGEVVVPIQCEYYALEGLGQLLRNVALVQRNLNQQLEVSTFVCVMYDARTKLADQVVSEVRTHFGDRVCRIVVPRTVRLSEAPSYGQPILAFDPRSRGAIAYRELAREISGGRLEVEASST